VRRATLLIALAACTYPEKEFREPFFCLGGPSPSTAPENVGLRGTVIDAREQTPLGGVQVTLLGENMSAIDGPETTNGSGAYDLGTPTGQNPVERIYLKAEGPDHETTFQTNSRTLAADLVTPLPMVSRANAAALASGSIGMNMPATFPPELGVLTMNILDCNGARLADAVVAATSAGAAVGRPFYFEGVFPSQTRQATDPFGVAMIANLPPGEVTLDVTVDGMPLPPRTFIIVAGAFVQHDVTPFTP
jgi:hypothetical protein